MSVVSLELAVTTRVCDSLGGPAVMPNRLTVRLPESSFTVMALSGLSVGGSLTADTVTTKLRLKVLLTLPRSSWTVTVIVAVTLALAAGVKVNVPDDLPVAYATVGVGVRAVLLGLAVTAWF